MLKLSFKNKIQTVRSDNALEFADFKFIQFFHDNGILHQTSCPHKPQQNARVERKHRHILEIARAIRFHAHLHVSLWGDCVQAAVHIINRLPTPVLKNSTPYYILHNKPPVYSHLKVIGCLAFAQNPSFTTDKLSPRVVLCLFLGYPSSQKGYKLLNLLTQTTFTSRDVKFHESIFPYHPDSLSSYMKLLPVSETILQPHAVFDEVDPYMSLTEGRHGMSPLTSSLSPENDEHLDTNNSSLNTTSPNTIPPPPVRKSTRTRQTPHWLQQYQTFQASSSLNTSTSIPRVSNLAFTTTQP